MPSPLLFSVPMSLLFWSSVWAAPVRAALGETCLDALLNDLPTWPVVRQFGPLCVQRLIARAIVQRLAWLREQHIPLLPRYEQDSAVEWECLALRPNIWQNQSELSEWDLHFSFGLLTEWLLHMVAAPPDAVAPPLRAAAIAGACGHIARIYAEWKRRVGAARAREIIREDLLHYVGPQAKVA